jgi:glycosyltransferase involved in cell wall biosynthesis
MDEKDVQRDPYVSVVITAHNRKEFLKEAINSVINQTLDKDFYEIIVVKNFDDQEIDNLIEKNEITNLKSRDDSLIGEDLALGIERARGEVISFLDDDDLFIPEKLETVYNFFKKYKDLAYLHNNDYFFDEKGNPAKFWVKDISKDIIFDHFKDLNELFKLQRYGLYFNMSSINVRKNKILPYLGYLKKIKLNPDDFMFFISTLEEPRLITLSKEKLTKYRIHQSTSVFLNEDINKFLNDRIKYEENGLYSYTVMMSLVEKNKIYGLFFKYNIILFKIKLHLLKHTNEIKLNEFLFYLYIVLKIKTLRSKIVYVYYMALFIFSKISFTREIEFYTRRFFKYNQK